MTIRSLLMSAALFVAGAGSGLAVQEPARPAAEVAGALQAKYDTVKDFSADFVQTYEGGVLRKKAVERGVVLIKKPGRMRWEYQNPEKKVFVSDGRKMYLHEVRANQVTVFDVPRTDEAATAALFLAGKGHLTRDFNVSYSDGGGPDTYALRLQPKTRERDYDWLVVVVDRKTLQIRSLSAVDNQGGRQTFQFSKLRENIGVPDRTFDFRIPRGADVIRSDSSGR